MNPSEYLRLAVVGGPKIQARVELHEGRCPLEIFQVLSVGEILRVIENAWN